MRTFRYVIADVFTDTPLAGNQLDAVTIAWMAQSRLLGAR